MRCFKSVTKRRMKSDTRSVSVMAKMIKSDDAISSHHSFDRCPMILWIIGMHRAHSNGNNQLNPMALFTPRFVDDKFVNFVAVTLCCFCGTSLPPDAIWTWSAMHSEFVSDDGEIVVVFVLIDIFFIDFLPTFPPPPPSFANFVIDAYIDDVSISSSDCMISTIAMSVDELNSRIAAKLELSSPYHSCEWQKMRERKIIK